MISLTKADESSRAALISFLKAHEEYSLFLLGNLEVYGPNLTDELYSGNFKFIRHKKEIIAVFSLTKGGTLLIYSSQINEPLFELVLQACLEETIPLEGVIGEWEFCHRFWEFLKGKGLITKEVYTSKEILYSADLLQLCFEKEQLVRFLTPDDINQWLPLRRNYIQEMKFPGGESEEELCKEFQMKVKDKISWGLFLGDRLISIADLNARAFDLGQVGGVYTLPEYRKQGFSTAVMRQLMHDASRIHQIRKLIIFTGEANFSARKVYESLGVSPFGHYALLFGKK